MRTVRLRDRGRLEGFLRRNTFLNLYSLGDLDDRFWPFTTWHAVTDAGEVKAVALMYTGLSRPVLLALGSDEMPSLEALMRALVPVLPGRFYAHLSLGLSDLLRRHYRLTSYGEHCKMGLTDGSELTQIDTSRVAPLGPPDLPELLSFYEQSYPENSFEPGMLDTGPYCAIRGPGGLLSVAGVHVYSGRYRVAALGNIATHPDHRGRGLARAVVAALCTKLLRTVDHIGLNVRAANAAAVRCYASLGFEVVASYEECAVEQACTGQIP